MAYAFNDDKSKAEVYSKEAFKVGRYTNTSSVTINANSRNFVSIFTDIPLTNLDTLNNKILGIPQLSVNSIDKLCLVGWSISRNANDTLTLNVTYYNPTSSAITISNGIIIAKIAYLD